MKLDIQSEADNGPNGLVEDWDEVRRKCHRYESSS